MLTAAFAGRVLHQDLFLPSPMLRGAHSDTGADPGSSERGFEKTPRSRGATCPQILSKELLRNSVSPPPPISSH